MSHFLGPSGMKILISHHVENYPDMGGGITGTVETCTIFGGISAISKNIKKKSGRQSVKKLQLIMIFDFCTALWTLAMKDFGFYIGT